MSSPRDALVVLIVFVSLKARGHSLGGYLKIGTIQGVPVFIHWSFPAGGFLVSFWVGFDLEAAAYYLSGLLDPGRNS